MVSNVCRLQLILLTQEFFYNHLPSSCLALDVNDKSHKVRGERVSFERFVFMDVNMKERAENGHSAIPVIRISEKYLEDPVIFAYLKDNGTAAYNQVKMASWHIFGVPSACAIHSNYEKQKSKDQ